MSYFTVTVVTADPKVTEVKKPVDPLTKKLIKEEKEKSLDNVPDDALVYWKDVKKSFPQLESQLKTLFAGKEFLTVTQLKERINKGVSDEEASLWLSEAPFDPRWGIQVELKNHSRKQVAIQLNIGPELVKAIDQSPVAQRFFSLYAKTLLNNTLHPNHSQTIAWARVYKLEDKWIIEELQSDIWGGSLKTADSPPDSKGYDIIEELSPEDRAELDSFFHKHFLDWDKKLIATVIRMARKAGVKDVYMWDESIKKKVTQSKSKLEKLYNVVPRDLGFKRAMLDVDGREYPTWHRIVASFLDKIGSEP